MMKPFRLVSVLAVCISLLCIASANAQERPRACNASSAANASENGIQVTNGSTVFSGDLLATDGKGQIRIQCGPVQFALKENSTMRVFRVGAKTSAELERGTVLYSAPGNSEDLTIYSRDIRIVPRTTERATGTVSSLSDCESTVTASKGSITVTSGDETGTIEESKTYEVTAVVAVDYRGSWKPVLADYPDSRPDAEYHASHAHLAACAPPDGGQAGNPAHAGHHGRLREIEAAGGAAAIIIPAAILALESPCLP